MTIQGIVAPMKTIPANVMGNNIRGLPSAV
jgi:hypothetical protein